MASENQDTIQSSTEEKQTPLKNSPARRWMMLLALCFLLGVAGYEWHVYHSYSRTAKSVQDVTQEAAKGLSAVPVTKLETIVWGSPTQMAQDHRGGKIVELTWSGLFRSYSLQVWTGPGDQIVYGAPPAQPVPVAKPSAKSPVNGPPKKDAQQGGDVGQPAGKSAALLLTITPTAAQPDESLLLHELTRQAIAMTARDELGVSTRDILLGEKLETQVAPGVNPLQVGVFTDADQHFLFALAKRVKGRGVVVGEFEVSLPDNKILEAVAARVEAQSRKEFIETLEKQGITRKPLPAPSKAEIPQEISEKLARMNCLAQFAGLRALHDQVRKQGESPELLAGLARGYALLGSLTEYLWTPAHKIFKARGLLYAERLLARSPDEKAYNTRAYVRALVGLHQSALDDLEAATEKSDGKTGKRKGFASVIEAYCRGDEAELEDLATSGPQQRLACYLQLLIAESIHSPEVKFAAARKMLELDTDCARAAEAAVAGNVPLGIQRTISDAAPEAFANSLYAEILGIDNLPKSVRDVASGEPEDEVAHRVKLMQALREAGKLDQDQGEPSLSVAAHLIQNVGFVYAWRRLDLERNALGVDADESLKELLPLVMGHPYQRFIESFVHDEGAAKKKREELTAVITWSHAEAAEEPAYTALNNQKGYSLKMKSLEYADFVFRDLLDFTKRAQTPPQKRAAARALREVSPYSLATIVASIKYDREYVQPLAEAWESKYSQQATVITALADLHFNLNQDDAAERCMKRRIELEPDQDGYNELATFYESQGDEEKRIKVLQESLKLPSYGLEDIHTHTALARYFMARNDPKSAWPHAFAAAESWSAFGMLCAADCREQMGDWKESEAYVKRTAERYDSSKELWYLWCRRTGKGDLDAARALGKETLERENLGLYLYLEGKVAEARKLYQAYLEQTRNPYFGLHAALFADELGDTTARDNLLELSHAFAFLKSSPLQELVGNFQRDLATKDRVPFDIPVNDWQTRAADAKRGARTDRFYFIGRYLLQRGRVEEGVRYLQLAASSPRRQEFSAIMAGHILVQRKVPRQPLRATELEGDAQTIADLVSTVGELVRNGQVEQARKRVAEALKLQADSVDALAARAQIAISQEDYVAAIADLTSCLEKLPNSVVLLSQLGNCRRLAGDPTGAIRDFEAALKIDPRDETTLHNMALCYEHQERWDAAETSIKRLAALSHSKSTAWYRWCRRTGHGDVAAARILAGDLFAAKKDKPNTNSIANAAVYLYLERDYQRSSEMLREALVGPGKSLYCGLLAALIADEGNMPDARDKLLQETLQAAHSNTDGLKELIHDFQNALAAKDPVAFDLKINEVRLRSTPGRTPSERLYLIGKFLLLRGRTEEGIACLQRAASSPSDREYAAIMAGDTLVRRGIKPQPPRAAEFEGATGRALGVLSLVHAQFDKQQFWVLRQCIERALTIDPKLIEAIYMRARVNEETQNYAAALPDCDRFLEQFPNSTNMLWIRARCRAGVGDNAGAIADYERALQIDPHLITACYYLAELLAACEDPQFRNGTKAVEYAQRMMTMEGTISPQWRETCLASAYAEAGNFPEAVKHCEAAIAIMPQATQSYHIRDRLELFNLKRPYHFPKKNFRARPLSW